jgi:hypothetical protein
MENHITREGWLLALVDALRPHLKAVGYEVPDKLRISCGFPSTRALSTKNRRIGECWAFEASDDGYINVLISPTLADPLEIAAVTVHELGHAHGIHGHKGKFTAFMRAAGLEGKPTATVAGAKLQADLQIIVDRLGPYPHGKIDKTAGPAKKHGTRMRKISCENAEHEKYILRGATKTLAQGVPECPLCGNDMIVEEKDEEEETEAA